MFDLKIGDKVQTGKDAKKYFIHITKDWLKREQKDIIILSLIVTFLTISFIKWNGYIQPNSNIFEEAGGHHQQI